MEQEIWVEARRHENYEVSNMGQMRRKKNGRIIKQAVGTNGYMVVRIWTNKTKFTRAVARIVWESFNDCACGLTIDHIDRNKLNNNLSNLRCITLEENKKNRTIYRRTNKYNLNDDKRRIIINNIATGKWTKYKACKEMGVPANYISIVVRRGSWNKFLDESNRV